MEGFWVKRLYRAIDDVYVVNTNYKIFTVDQVKELLSEMPRYPTPEEIRALDAAEQYELFDFTIQLEDKSRWVVEHDKSRCLNPEVSNRWFNCHANMDTHDGLFNNEFMLILEEDDQDSEETEETDNLPDITLSGDRSEIFIDDFFAVDLNFGSGIDRKNLQRLGIDYTDSEHDTVVISPLGLIQLGALLLKEGK